MWDGLPFKQLISLALPLRYCLVNMCTGGRRLLAGCSAQGPSSAIILATAPQRTLPRPACCTSRKPSGRGAMGNPRLD